MAVPGSPRARGIGSTEHFVAVDTSWNVKRRSGGEQVVNGNFVNRCGRFPAIGGPAEGCAHPWGQMRHRCRRRVCLRRPLPSLSPDPVPHLDRVSFPLVQLVSIRFLSVSTYREVPSSSRSSLCPLIYFFTLRFVVKRRWWWRVKGGMGGCFSVSGRNFLLPSLIWFALRNVIM